VTSINVDAITVYGAMQLWGVRELQLLSLSLSPEYLTPTSRSGITTK
jgi:hypothetical protein